MAIDGKYDLVMKTPMGEQKGVIDIKQEGDAVTGQMSAQGNSTAIEDGKVDGDKVTWNAKITTPMPMTLEFEGNVEGDAINGNVKLGAFGTSAFSATKA
ncbi:MAG: hypothetical protein AAGB02_05760 [Pseudomonadota bacterium]